MSSSRRADYTPHPLTSSSLQGERRGGKTGPLTDAAEGNHRESRPAQMLSAAPRIISLISRKSPSSAGRREERETQTWRWRGRREVQEDKERETASTTTDLPAEVSVL